MGQYILDDFSRDPVNGVLKNEKLLKVNNTKWLGHCLCLAPFEARTLIDYTAPSGATTGLYYALTFQLGKWEFKVMKADDWIEVSPVFSQYYQVTLKQKEDLENKIKSGLASAAQAVADLELLKHDERKYREFLDYFGYRTFGELEKEDKKRVEKYKKDTGKDVSNDEIFLDEDRKFVEKRIDEHYLRALFIDQVDAHTGENISIRTIVGRWPTLIIDFQRLTPQHIDADKIMKDLDISKAEATVLTTKNRLYLEWKKLFEPQIKMRYQRMSELVRSREKSVKEYREWLRPIVARHQMIQEGLSRRPVRDLFKTSFIAAPGQALSSSVTEIWTWRDMPSPEYYKAPGEILAKKPVDVYDDWTKKNLIFNREHGLIVKYPWVTDKWVEEKKEEIYNEQLMKKHALYYSFFVIKHIKTNIRSATGDELEDGQFDVNAIFMSQNALFVKILELKAKHEELNQHIDSLLGISPEKSETRLEKEKQSKFKYVKKFFDTLNVGMEFAKKGPYERDFDERITKYYLMPMARDRYAPIVGFIKKKIGFGTA